MRTYFLRRVLQSIAVIFAASVLAFSLVFLSGDPVAAVVPADATQEEIGRAIEYYGFDQPLPVQYLRFLRGAAQGDLGNSLRYRVSTAELVADRLPATGLLVLAAMTVTFGLALVLGILSAVKRDSIFDQVTLFLTTFGQAMPTFWFGILLILLFSVTLNWLPPSGYGGAAFLVLPALTLSLYQLPQFLRVVRSSVQEVLGEDFIRTARSKGMSEMAVFTRHALRNALIPIVTLLGLELGTMFGGAVVTETVFAWPGLGRLLIEAIRSADFPLVQTAVLVIAVLITTINLIVDLTYVVLDPRVRLNAS
jgi:ABC-type dipeptide/oligopeptide/nickel transport system permease component